MYEVKFSDKALKQLKKLTKDINSRIIATLNRIRIRPYAHVKRMVGSPYFCIRVGDYRVILDIKNDKLLIIVIKVGDRKNVYKNNL